VNSPRVGLLGKIGAAVLMIGLVLAGVGNILVGSAEYTSVNCEFSGSRSSCIQAAQQADNTSAIADILLGVGYVVLGAGLFLVALAAVRFLGRPDTFPVSAPPPPPRAPDVYAPPESRPGFPPPMWGPPPGGGTPPPGSSP
jgi:hypothetical protein